MFTDKLKYSLALIILSVILYANTLQNGYVIDDGQVITNNKLVAQGISAIPELLATPRLKGFGPVENDTYRPIPMVSFAIENQFWGNNPFIGHLFNILLFSTCVIVLFVFLGRLFKNDVVAFIAALLFAVHPIHTEVVAYIKSRDELLCFLFAFCALNTFISYKEKGGKIYLVGGMLLFLLSLLSKETAISFIAIIPLIFFVYANEHKKRSVFITVSTLVATVLFFMARAAILDTAHATDVVFMSNPLVSAPDLATRKATALLGLGMYLKLLFIPYPLICDYSYNTIPFTGFGNIYVLLSLAIYLLLAVIAIYRMMKKNKDPWAFGILFFLVTIALFSNIPFLVYSQFAERFLFFPSVGFCFITALAINKWLLKTGKNAHYTYPLNQPKILAILLPITLLFGYLTYARNKDWKDNFTLYATDVQKAPENGWLCYGVGNLLITTVLDNEKDIASKKRIVDDATAYLSMATSLMPDHANAHAQLSYAYTKKRMPDSAKAHAIAALNINPLNVGAITSLGALYFSTKEFEKAIACFKKVLEIRPGYTEQYFNIGMSYLQIHKFDSSIGYFRQSLVYAPNDKRPYGNIAIAYNIIGLRDSAIKYEQITKQYFSDFKLPTN